MGIDGTSTRSTIGSKVLVVLAAPLSLAAAFNGAGTSEHPSERVRRRRRVFVSEHEMPLFCELLIEYGGGVREVARLFNINSGLVTMARGGYYAPAFTNALNVTRNPPRIRWSSETTHEVRSRLATCQSALGISRSEMLALMLGLLENDRVLWKDYEE